MSTRTASATQQSARQRLSRAVRWCAAALCIASHATPLHAQTTSRTQVIMLGTGTPIPDPERSGPAIAIVVDSTAYLFDAGTGVVRRAAAAARMGVTALRSPYLGLLFLTHLHSDHTLGLNDVLFTPWIQGRAQPLELYGPPGTAHLANSIVDAYSEDIAERLSSSGGPAPGAFRANVHEIAEGTVFTDSRVTIRAFEVPHNEWKHAFGYRIQTPDKLIVISGDARATPAIARECNGCDILIHEVYSDAGFATIPPIRQKYHANAHTSATQLGDIATQARPKLLVLYHQLYFTASDSTLVAEVKSRFGGRVVSAIDLQRF